jgi:hypothetical protein
MRRLGLSLIGMVCLSNAAVAPSISYKIFVDGELVTTTSKDVFHMEVGTKDGSHFFDCLLDKKRRTLKVGVRDVPGKSGSILTGKLKDLKGILSPAQCQKWFETTQALVSEIRTLANAIDLSSIKSANYTPAEDTIIRTMATSIENIDSYSKEIVLPFASNTLYSVNKLRLLKTAIVTITESIIYITSSASEYVSPELVKALGKKGCDLISQSTKLWNHEDTLYSYVESHLRFSWD